MGKIFETLESLDLTSEQTVEIFSQSTRDVKNLKVLKDIIRFSKICETKLADRWCATCDEAFCDPFADPQTS